MTRMPARAAILFLMAVVLLWPPPGALAQGPPSTAAASPSSEPEPPAYPRWETVPAGGVSPPAMTIDTLDEAALKENLLEEMREELDATFDVGRPVALVRDHMAFSEDIAFLVDGGRLSEAQAKVGAANWEYSETCWVPVDAIGAFDREHGPETIAASRGVFRVLGWGK